MPSGSSRSGAVQGGKQWQHDRESDEGDQQEWTDQVDVVVPGSDVASVELAGVVALSESDDWVFVAVVLHWEGLRVSVGPPSATGRWRDAVALDERFDV